jgi:hypothetical protein
VFQSAPFSITWKAARALDEFLHQFPSVKREFAITVLDAAYETVAADANIA